MSSRVRYARQAAVAEQTFFDLTRPHSNFDLVDEYFDGSYPMRRIMSQVRAGGGETAVLEELPRGPSGGEDTAEEDEDLRNACPDFLKSTVCRVSFFRKGVTTNRQLNALDSGEFLGYAILKKNHGLPELSRYRVYESIVRPIRHDNNYVRGAQTWGCAVGGGEFQVKGYLYAQQNGVTNCCSHVAARTVAAGFHPAGDMTYREMNDLLGIRHLPGKGLRKGGSGLTVGEICRILEEAGAACKVAAYNNLKDPDPPPFWKYVYASVESGYGAIIWFTTRRNARNHTVPVFGHTFNGDAWVPSAEIGYFRVGAKIKYIGSDMWLSTFLAHDDNCGSNFCIPGRYLYTKRVCARPKRKSEWCALESDCIKFIIGTRPSDVRYDGFRAELMGSDYLLGMIPQMNKGVNKWCERLLEYARLRRVVLRTILVDVDSYRRHLEKARDWEGHEVDGWVKRALEKEANRKLWMIEMSVPELFSANKRKVGEVLLNAEVEPAEKQPYGNYYLGRIPGHFVLRTADAGRYRFRDSRLGSHIQLYGCE